MTSWKKVIISGSDAALNSLNIATSLTGSSATFSGNVGIGTTLPSTKLHIVGKITLNDGGNSVFIGTDSGLNDDGTANGNTGVGVSSLRNNTSGFTNVAIGLNTLISNTTGFDNTAVGVNSLFSTLTTNSNIAIGRNSLFYLTSGNRNVGIGMSSGLLTGDGFTHTTTNTSVFIGFNSKPRANSQQNQIVIGNEAIGNGSNTTTIGNSNTTLFRPHGNVAIGADTAGARLDVRAQGSLSTDIAFRVRNSANISDLFKVQGDGNVGIGTTTPTELLDVNGDVTITDKIIHKGDTDTFIRFSNNDEITLDAGAQNQVKITSSGSGRVEVQKQLHAGDYDSIVGTGYDLHDGVSSIIDTDEFSEETTNLYVSGDILSKQTAGENGILASHLVYLETDGKWYTASATSAGEVDRFLGIALNSASLNDDLDVLIDGIINYNTDAAQHAQLISGAEPGAPIYASTTSGQVTEVAPSTAGTPASGGNIVKVLGHNISGNGILRTAAIRFQPDNTWIEL